MSSNQPVYWDMLEHPLFESIPIFLAATNKGVCLITLPNECFATMEQRIRKMVPDGLLIQNNEKLAIPTAQLREYLDGVRQSFTFPLDLIGTTFQCMIWKALIRIPYGQVQSYSQIAEAVGSPRAVRAVGAANGRNPIPFVVPCHRVIGKSKELTGYRGGLAVKQSLLNLEGFEQ